MEGKPETPPSSPRIWRALIATLVVGIVGVSPTSPVTAGIGLDDTADTGAPARRVGAAFQLTAPPPPPPPPVWVMPEHGATGRRAVYSKTNQWVWTVEDDGTISSANPVSGNRRWNLPQVGEYVVSSRSSFTCSLTKPNLCWRYMVRFASGPEALTGDNIGFHEIPNDRNNGNRPVQSEAQLGRPLSGGCVRMATPAAEFMWAWAPIGTRVVVLP